MSFDFSADGCLASWSGDAFNDGADSELVFFSALRCISFASSSRFCSAVRLEISGEFTGFMRLPPVALLPKAGLTSHQSFHRTSR